MKVFNFNPVEYQAEYAKNGYVHVAKGVDPEFLTFARTYARDAIDRDDSLKEWHFKNKKSQFLFEFPPEVDFVGDLKQVVGEVAGMDRNSVTLCERHVKVYNDKAASNPPPHKDRLASELTVGIPLEVPENSYIVLYPDHCREVNHFASTAQHRASLRDEDLPETLLADVQPQEHRVWPGDVILFRGSSMYHERVNPANTSLLYLKFNSMGLDPLGEDPATIEARSYSELAISDLSDRALLQTQLMLSPRLERISRHYSRLYWREILQAKLWNEDDVYLDSEEFELLRALGHEHLRACDLLRRIGIDGADQHSRLPRLRRIISVGLVDIRS